MRENLNKFVQEALSHYAVNNAVRFAINEPDFERIARPVGAKIDAIEAFAFGLGKRRHETVNQTASIGRPQI